MRLYLLIIGIVALLFLTACNTSENEVEYLTPETLYDILNISNARRHAITPPDEYRIAQFTQGLEPVPPEVIERISSTNTQSPDYLPTDMLRCDIFCFFYALRGYAMYIYFGGDDVFHPIREEILQTLDTRAYWYINEFVDLVRASISPAMEDGHSHFGGATWPSIFLPEYLFFTYDGRFHIDDKGIANQLTGLHVQAISLPCRPNLVFDVQNSFRLSMCESGDVFFYALVIPVRHNIDYAVPENIKITYADSSGAITIEYVTLDLVTTQWIPWDDAPVLEWVQGVPIITLTGWGPPWRQNARQFVGYAEELRDEPVIIVDLRSNMGGDNATVRTWFHRLLRGELVEPMYAHLITEMHVLLAMNGMETDFGVYQIRDRQSDYRVVPSNRLLIVLVDRFSASATEDFVVHTLAVKNTLIIGQNTAGMLLSHGDSTRSLRYSGVTFNASGAGFIFPYGLFTEGIGFAPDIWVTGDALAATLGMLEHHLYQMVEMP